MCCDDTPTAPEGKETRFSNALADIMMERQANARKFQPLEDQLINRVQEFQSPEFLAREQGKALADVDASFAKSQAANEQNLASMGVNPNSSAYAGNALKMTLGRSLGRSGALAQTNDIVRRMGYDALAGVSGRGDAKVGQAISAAGQGGQLLNQNQQNQVTAAGQGGGASEGIGQLAGMAGGLMMFSSKKAKEDIEPADDALEATRDMPAKKWKYRKITGLDQDQHTGPMAEDYQAATGHGDGKMIDVGDLAGVTLAAVQQLDRKVRRLEARHG